MKKILYLLLIVVAGKQLSAQSNCTNTVSTNWENPVNSNLPDTSMSGGVDVHYLNYFDWTQEPIPYNGMNPVYNYPFYGLKYDSDQYYRYISEGEDMTPKNGWELVNFNLGYYPDLTAYHPAIKQDIPYIVLYNRITGIMRVFAVYGSNFLNSGVAFDGVRVSVLFDNLNRVNGNFRLSNGTDKPLDQNTKATRIDAMSYYTNSSGEWFSADFQMTYDPCICFFPSKFRLEFQFLNSSYLTLMGRSITVEDEIATGHNLLENNFLTNFYYNGSKVEDQIVMYKVLDDFIDDYDKRLDAYRAELAAANEINSKLERLSVVIKLFKHVVISGGSSVVDDISDAIWYTNALTWAYDLITPNNASDSTIVKTKEKISAEAKSGIAKLVDLFIQKNYSSQDLPTEPTAPTASFTEMVLQGSIKDTMKLQIPAFYVPGTYGTPGSDTLPLSNKAEYPIYNNALGTFALLNTPEIKAYKNSQLYNQYTESDTIIDTVPYFPGYNNIMIDTTINNYRYASWQNNYQFKLDNSLYYVFNPAADIKSHTVKAALVFEGKLTKNPVTTYPDYSGTNNAYIDPVNTTNLNSQDVEVNEYYPVKVTDGKGFNNGQNYCIDGNSNCSYLENNVWETTIEKDSLTFTTDYFPVDAIQSLVFGAGIMNQFYGVYESNHAFSYPAATKGWEFTITGIKLKLLVDVTHNYLNEDASNVTNTWALTYEIDPNDVNWATSELVSNLENSSLNVDSYSEDLILTATVFDGSDVIGCRLDGTHYTCKGWNSVSVIGDLTTANGYTVDIIGGNLVDVSGEVQIDPEINLSIGTVLDYSQPMPVVTNEFLKDYCQHNLNGNFPYYQGNTANKGDVVSGDGDNENTTGSNVVLEENLATVYPVPTTSELNVLVDKKLEIKDIIISDLTGRIIELKSNRITDNHVLLNAESVSSGTYSMKIRTNQGIISKLFIVVH